MDLLQSVDPTGSGLSSSDPYRPSFFELAAQDQLRDLIQPALRYVIAVLAQRNPRYLIRIVNSFDEFYALLMFLIERHYLKTWGSSFSENFYGLRRRRRPGVSTDRARSATSRSSGISSNEALRRKERFSSLFFLVGLPYLQSKATDYWESIGGGVEAAGEDLFGDEERGGLDGDGSQARSFNEQQTETRITRLRNLVKISFRKGFPYLGSLYQFWLLTYNLAYLFDKTPYWRPWLQFMRVDVRRVGSDDYPPSPPLLPPNLPSPLKSPFRFFFSILRSSPFIFFEALKYALPASIFFFKFLEWWYSSDNPRRRRSGGNNASGEGGGGGGEGGLGLSQTLGAPKVLKPHSKGCLFIKDERFKDFRIPREIHRDENDEERISNTSNEKSRDLKTSSTDLLHNGCPLCGTSPINNPCALPTGYVLCYTCAHDYVGKHGKCPVTLREIKGGVDELRKVLG